MFLANVIENIKKVASYRYVKLNDIICHGDELTRIKTWEYEEDTIDIEKLIEILPAIWEFEWGDFFLFKEFPMSWINDHKYPPLLK